MDCLGFVVTSVNFVPVCDLVLFYFKLVAHAFPRTYSFTCLARGLWQRELTVYYPCVWRHCPSSFRIKSLSACLSSESDKYGHAPVLCDSQRARATNRFRISEAYYGQLIFSGFRGSTKTCCLGVRIVT